jgi:hypothetical protein
MVVAFEPDDGFMDSFLSMEQIQEDYYDGTKKFDYGAKYNSSYVVNITVVKNNGSDFSLKEVRSLSKWLTGSRVNSWLDVGSVRFEQGKDDDKNIKYSFLGRVTNLQPRKLDGRTIGFLIEFSSVSPWAFSTPQSFPKCVIGQRADIDSEGVLIQSGENASKFGFDDGVLCVSSDVGNYFMMHNDGTVYIDNRYRTNIDNESDDLYTYIYLDIDYQNQDGTYISIKNATLGEETLINNVSKNESITISSKQFIISNIPNKLFGDSFNFVWPRLQPGHNDFIIDGDGHGTAQFTYRYPMKVGDCAMDISVYGGNNDCGEIAAYDTVKWENIVGIPTTLGGYGITDAYTENEIDHKLEDINSNFDNKIKNINIDWNSVSNTPTTISGYGITDAYTTSDVYTKTEVDDIVDDIEITGGGTNGSVNIDEQELNNMLKDILG